MDSDIGEIRRALRERLLQTSISLENGSIENIDYELETILCYLTELSYYEDVNFIIDIVKEASCLLTSSIDNNLAPNKPHLVYTHMKGRPSFNIPENTLRYYIDNKFTIKQMSGILSVSERTVANRMREHGLSIRLSYTQLDDVALDAEVKKKVEVFPTVGYRTIKAHLWSDGVRITDKRIQDSKRRVDPLGVRLRNLFLKTYRIRRRSYNVPAPMSLWHVDTNHKLIRIERFWRELWQGCTCTFYNLFWSLEGQGILDVDNEIHVLALHLVYLSRIQECLDKFCAAVAQRLLRTENQKTPMQLWITGQVLNPAVQLTNQDSHLYGVDFSGPVDTNPEEDIVVPPLYEVDDNIRNEVESLRSRDVSDPYEFQTFVDVCSYLLVR